MIPISGWRRAHALNRRDSTWQYTMSETGGLDWVTESLAAFSSHVVSYFNCYFNCSGQNTGWRIPYRALKRCCICQSATPGLLPTPGNIRSTTRYRVLSTEYRAKTEHKALLYTPVAAAIDNHANIHTEYFVEPESIQLVTCQYWILYTSVFGVLDNQPRQPENQSQADRVYILDHRENKEMEILRIYLCLSGWVNGAMMGILSSKIPVWYAR